MADKIEGLQNNVYLSDQDDAETQKAASLVQDDQIDRIIAEKSKAGDGEDKEALIEGTEPETAWLKSKFQIMKNLLVICFAWVFQFTAYQSMANLQSSLNSDQGLGTASLSSIYVALVVSCLFVPPIMIRNLGLKWTIVISQCTYLFFIAANMYPKWYILMPAAVILGMGAAPLWTAKCTYLSEVAAHYSKLNKETTEAAVNRFFGIFFAMFQTTQIWGNVVSSTIFQPDNDGNSSNSSFNYHCGAQDCPGSPDSKIKRPALSKVYTLCGIYLGLAVVSILIVIFLLNTYKRKESTHKTDAKGQFGLLVETLKHLKKPYQLLIVPLTLWLGFMQAFIGADYTKSFVACSKGVHYVGLTMICFGVTDAMSSYLFGYLVKFVGRIPCFLIAATLNYGLIIFMLIWRPTPDQVYVLFLIPVFWGFADGAWQTQSNALYGVLFKDTHEAAFSNFRLWESMGFAIAYAYSGFLCVSIKLYLLLAYLTTGLIGYAIIEVMERRRKREELAKSEGIQ